MYSVSRYKHSQTLVMAGKKLIRETIRDLQKVFLYSQCIYFLIKSPQQTVCAKLRKFLTSRNCA